MALIVVEKVVKFVVKFCDVLFVDVVFVMDEACVESRLVVSTVLSKTRLLAF